MSELVRDPTDELVVFAVPPEVRHLPPDVRDDYCYWPMIRAIATQTPLTPLGPVQDATFQFMVQPDDEHRIELRHPCAECQKSVGQAAAMLDGVEPGSVTICVAQCVVVYLRDIRALHGRYSPIMRSSDGI